MESRNINVRGPGGLTPLMIASMSGKAEHCRHNSLDQMNGYYGASGSASIISDLLAEGAAINTTTDRTGMRCTVCAGWYNTGARYVTNNNDNNQYNNVKLLHYGVEICSRALENLSLLYPYITLL